MTKTDREVLLEVSKNAGSGKTALREARQIMSNAGVAQKGSAQPVAGGQPKSHADAQEGSAQPKSNAKPKSGAGAQPVASVKKAFLKPKVSAMKDSSKPIANKGERLSLVTSESSPDPQREASPQPVAREEQSQPVAREEELQHDFWDRGTFVGLFFTN